MGNLISPFDISHGMKIYPLHKGLHNKYNKMRRPERIPIVMRNLDIEKFLKDNLGKQYLPEMLTNVVKDWGKIEDGWKEQYDIRLGQYLVNQGYTPDNIRIWNVEEVDYMIDHDMIEPREICFWGVNYTKDMKKLRETEYLLIKDLETDHIEAILGKNDIGKKWVKDGSPYEGYLENELERREEEQIHDDE